MTRRLGLVFVSVSLLASMAGPVYAAPDESGSGVPTLPERSWAEAASAIEQSFPTLAVSGTVAATQSGTWNITNITGTVSLPTGAATAAKQPALGTAGSPSTDVISIQGVASGTAVPISAASLPTHAVTQSGTWTVQPGNTANTTPWLFTISQAGNSAAVNASGQLSVTCANCSGTGVSVNEDVASAGGDPGTPAYGVRSDTLGSTTSANGDYIPLKTDVNGALWINPFSTTPAAGTYLPVRLTDGSNFASADTQLTHDGAMTPASTTGGAQFFRGSSSAPTAVSASDDAVLPWADLNGRLHVTGDSSMTALKVDGSGVTQPVSDGGGSLTVDGSVTVTQATGTNLHIVCDSGCSSSSGFGDNGAFTFGTTSINPIGAVFDDTSPNTATENSAAVLRMTQNKALHINLRNASGTEIGTSSNPVQVTLANTGANATAVKVDGSAVTQPISGSLTNISGTISLPTGASTSANQSTMITALQLIDDDQTGATPSAVASAASTNATNVKASAGRLLGVYLVNTTGTIYYIRFYNLATSPTCSSATGYLFTLPVPASTSGAGFSMSFPQGGLAFGTGVGYCITGGASSTDNTSAATGIYGVISYK